MWVEGHHGRIAAVQDTAVWVEGPKDMTGELQTFRMQQRKSKGLTEELQTAGMIWGIVRNKRDKGPWRNLSEERQMAWMM